MPPGPTGRTLFPSSAPVPAVVPTTPEAPEPAVVPTTLEAPEPGADGPSSVWPVSEALGSNPRRALGHSASTSPFERVVRPENDEAESDAGETKGEATISREDGEDGEDGEGEGQEGVVGPLAVDFGVRPQAYDAEPLAAKVRHYYGCWRVGDSSHHPSPRRRDPPATPTSPGPTPTRQAAGYTPRRPLQAAPRASAGSLREAVEAVLAVVEWLRAAITGRRGLRPGAPSPAAPRRRGTATQAIQETAGRLPRGAASEETGAVAPPRSPPIVLTGQASPSRTTAPASPSATPVRGVGGVVVVGGA